METNKIKYSLDWLTSQVGNEATINYIFFWKPTVTSVITKSCLSQWYRSNFVVNNIEYKTAEHWMMSQKALLFNDQETNQLILETDDPGKVQQLGRKVKNFDLKIWNQNCFNIICKGNYYKFSQNKELRNFLINTKEAVLVEASPLDKIWGIGMSEDQQEVTNPFLWKGTNLLGFALMEVRDILKNNEDEI